MVSVTNKEGSDVMLIFGGSDGAGDYLDTLHTYNPSSQTYSLVDVVPPEREEEGKEKQKWGVLVEYGLARSFASMVAWNDALYVFGGKDKFIRNDLWRLHTGKRSNVSFPLN